MNYQNKNNKNKNNYINNFNALVGIILFLNFNIIFRYYQKILNKKYIF